MTETSSISVLRSTTVMFLFVGLVGIWTGGCEETQEQEVEGLIRELWELGYNYTVGDAASL